MPALALCTAVLMMGVEECDPNTIDAQLEEMLNLETEPVKSAISIHEVVKYPRANETERVVPSYFGTDVTIRKLPLLFYKEIMSVTIMERPHEPGFYDLQLKLTSRGRKMWIGLSVPHQNDYLAFLVDGMYYRAFRPRMIYGDETDTVIIDGPFDQATARELAAQAARNYKKGLRQQ